MGHQEVCPIQTLPDKVLLRILGFIPHKFLVSTCTRVCKRWKTSAADGRLWSFVSLRPEVSGINITSTEFLVLLIRNRFGTNLCYLELPCDLITVDVLNELAQRCPNLTHLLLDFSHGAQLADFQSLGSFPTKIRYLCFCLSETIFLDNFMKKIFNFINGTQMLHLYGTYEQGEEEEGEVYEVLNIRSLKQATPNLRVINLWGVSFVDDGHVEAFSSNCIQLAVMSVNFCPKVQGSCIKILLQRCKHLTCLMLQQTGLVGEHVMAAEWDKATSLRELDITATDLATNVIQDILTRVPGLTWLSAGQLDGMNDEVMEAWMGSGKSANIRCLDLDRSDNVTEGSIRKFIETHQQQLEGLVLTGMGHVTDMLFITCLPKTKNLRVLAMGTAERISLKIQFEHLIAAIAQNCPHLERLEFRWDREELRFSEKNQKAIDILRMSCLKLKSLVLCDSKLYEIMRANFERADLCSVVRTTVNSRVNLFYLLSHYSELSFQ